MMQLEKEFKALLPARKKDSHKGDYGHVFILAGSTGLTGAAVLSAQASLLAGTGLVTLGIAEGLNSIMEIKLTEVITKPLPETKTGSLSLKAKAEILRFQQRCDCLIIGPGLSRNRQTMQLVRNLIPRIKNKVILDADGIAALNGRHRDVLKNTRSQIVLTPHLGEFAELIACSTNVVSKKRSALIGRFIDNYNAVLVLKGNRTVVAKKGKGIYVNETGNPGMATAGSGDVLTGIIGGFVAQGLNVFEAAKLSVYLHGLAGDLAAREKTEYGLIASDILRNIPRAIKLVLGKKHECADVAQW